MPELLPSAAVCARLDIDRSTLSRLVAAGRLSPAMQLPGQTGAFLFHPADIETFAATYVKKGSAA